MGAELSVWTPPPCSFNYGCGGQNQHGAGQDAKLEALKWQLPNRRGWRQGGKPRSPGRPGDFNRFSVLHSWVSSDWGMKLNHHKFDGKNLVHWQMDTRGREVTESKSAEWHQRRNEDTTNWSELNLFLESKKTIKWNCVNNSNLLLDTISRANPRNPGPDRIPTDNRTHSRSFQNSIFSKNVYWNISFRGSSASIWRRTFISFRYLIPRFSIYKHKYNETLPSDQWEASSHSGVNIYVNEPCRKWQECSRPSVYL